MTIQEFLEDQLKNQSNYSLTDADKNKITDEGMQAYIYGKLTSKKFRRWAIDEVTKERIIKAIDIAVDNNKPLQLVFPQGGYKLWRFTDSYPEVDWAEFFNIAHVISYLSSIAEGYEHGVDLYYYMHTLVPEVHDNLPQEDIDAYVASFQKLIDEFSKYLPSNFSIKISKDADFYESRDHYFETLESHLEKGKKDFEDCTEEKQQGYLKTSELNIKWDGKEELTNLSSEEKTERIKKGAYYEKALSYLEEPRVFTKTDDKVLVFIKSGGGFLGIGSSKVSISKYWVGTGIIEKRGEKLYGRILSPNQYEKVKDKLESQSIDLMPMKNFGSVGVIGEQLNFVNR